MTGSITFYCDYKKLLHAMGISTNKLTIDENIAQEHGGVLVDFAYKPKLVVFLMFEDSLLATKFRIKYGSAIINTLQM